MTTTDWLTLALVVITAIYAWATFRILRANEALVAEMKHQRDAELRPYVTVSVRNRIGTQLLYLSIKNTGRCAAENLRLTLDRDYYQDGKKLEGKNIRSWTAFTNPIEDLPPSVELQFLLGGGPELLQDPAEAELSPPMFTVSVQYSFGDKSFSERTRVDLRPFTMSSVPHHPVAEELERVRKSIDQAATEIRTALKLRSIGPPDGGP